MNKSLEALEQLKYYNTLENDNFDMTPELDIIETALKDYENLQLKHRSRQDAVLDDFKKLKALEQITKIVEELE